MEYSDETRIPLKHVSPDDYNLAVSTSYRHLVGLVPKESKPYQPKIVAIKEGRGELFKIEFGLGKKCHKKKTLPLQTDIVIINADFSLPNTISNDDQYLADWPDHNNQPSERREHKRLDKPDYSFKSPQDDDKYKERNKYDKKGVPESQVYGIGIDLNQNLEQMAKSSKNMAYPANNEPEKTPAEDPGLSPLEIGMYVLLGVFGVVFTVFFAIVLMYRHKKKQAMNKSKGATVAQANDWVWIGSATLERNAINTECSQTLMSPNDFNGNRATSAPVDSGVHSAQSSNRSSFVSTIKGSECSIRITANPLPEELPNDNNNTNQEPEWDYEAMGMTYDQLADYFDNLKESTA